MKKKRPTSIQVAELAGVSRTTVSFVLNGVQANISPETRQKVLEAAEVLGYVPDAAAQRLVSGESRTLGLLICQNEHLQSDPFIPQVLHGMNQVAFAHGFRVLVEAVEDAHDPKLYRELLRAKQIDGLAVLNPRDQDFELLERLSEEHAIIDVGRGSKPVRPTPSKGSRSARAVVAHLLSLGHTRLAHITFAPPHYPVSERRKNGFLHAVCEAELEPTVQQGNFTAESGFEAMKAILASKTPPTAVFAGNDTIAFGVLRAAQETGLRVPDDLAVIGFDDIPLAAYASPPLTTVRVDASGLGQQAATRLIEHIRPNKSLAQITVGAPELVKRASCGRAL